MKISKMILALTVFCAGFVFAQEYVGSQQCGTCHPDKLADWSNSGHPYKFNVVENGVPPVYPNFVVNFEDDWMTGLGATWDDISGVIGGFGWKSRFVDNTGVIAGTASSIINPGAGHNQFNFYGGVDYGWVDYHAGDENKIYNYNCFKCHTTGATPDGSWLEGYDLGSFAESGVGCEACHGPGYDHGSFASPHLADPNYIDLVYEFDNNNGAGLNGVLPDPNGDDVNFLCGTCHNRGFSAPIDASGGFIRHHEQWDEFSATDHAAQGFTCATCHNPHKRVIWDGDGITMQCATCHPANVATLNHPVDLDCIDCHMPYAAKSGTTRGQSGYKADVRSHLWKITASTESMFTEDGSYVRDDADRPASLDLQHSCLSCHNDDPNDEIPDKTVDEIVEFASRMHTQTDGQYVGSETCQACHEENYNEWNESGHPYKFNVVENGNPPVYPNFVMNFEDDWMAGLGATWDDISGVIGGFGWKARFVDNTGTIAGTASSIINPGAGHNQFNFYGGVDYGWVDYHAGDENKIYNYNCFKCHTTGATPDGSWLEGYDLGSFAESGVGCEACHGPGGSHIGTQDPNDIDLVYEFDNNNGGGLNGVMPDPNGDDVNFLCGTCHNRGFSAPIDASGGFVRHHEQWDEFSATDHAAQGFTCATCHDPHKRVTWDGDGITMQCGTCHPDNVANFNHPVDLDCIDCHMPYAAKSGTTRGQSGYKADVRSHLWKITVSTESMFTIDGSYVRDDADRQASLDLQHTCLACHNDDPNDDIPDKTVEELVGFAAMIHAPADANTYVGPETCLSCHPDKSGWRTTLHANGFTVPKGENTMQDLYGVIADVDGNGVDDFMDGLDLSTVDAFAQYGANAPVLGYDADTDTYTITMGELTYPVALTYGGSGLYKQRYVLKVPLADGSESFGHYVSPVQFNEATDEYVTYHADAWYDEADMPIYGSSTTAADIAGNSRSFEKGCVGCHFTYTDVSQTADGEWMADAPDASEADMGVSTYDIDGDGTPDLINTSCERCHGPGGDHFGDPAGIVNPNDLTAQQANDLCGFCHSRGKSFPNETLSYPFNDVEGDMHDWEVGDVWGDYYINHGGFWGDGQIEGEKQTSKKHHQQYYDFYESSKPTFAYHEVRCSECHDPHGGGEHQVVEEIDEDGLIIATEPDNNTLCLACHSTHGDFSDISKEMVAEYDNNVEAIGAIVSEHTHHPYDPVNGPSRCTKCHMPKVAKSAVAYDIHSHTFEPIPPSKTLDYAMPNSCAVSCHREFENGADPIFGTGADLSLTDWAEPEDVALAEALMEYYGPCGEWWNQGEAVPGDVDNSCSLDILDVVQIVGYILGTQTFTDEQIAAADVDGNGSVDILDIVTIIDLILGGRIDKGEPVKSAQIMIESNQVNLTVDGKVAGVQLNVTGDFTIVTSNVSDGWEIQSSDDTILLYSLDGSPLLSTALFSFEGSLTIESGIVADWHNNGITVNTSVIPDTYVLNPAYPNPFNPATTISFGLPKESHVLIRVHDMLGHEVAVLTNENLSAGNHQIVWDAENYSSGVYLISMTSENVTLKQKVMLVK